jgi:hypothetical protein
MGKILFQHLFQNYIRQKSFVAQSILLLLAQLPRFLRLFASSRTNATFSASMSFEKTKHWSLEEMKRMKRGKERKGTGDLTCGN